MTSTRFLGTTLAAVLALTACDGGDSTSSGGAGAATAGSGGTGGGTAGSTTTGGGNTGGGATGGGTTGGGGTGGGTTGGGGTGGGNGQCAMVTCPEHAHCEVQAGAPECVCDAGFADSAGTCTDIDECQDGTANCPVGAGCKNLTGTYACDCDPGDVWDGTACAPAGVRTLDSGFEDVCRIEPDGRIACWGRITKKGAAPQQRESSPTIVSEDTDWVSISVGQSSKCGIKESGALLCWGYLPAGSYVKDPTELAPGTSWANVDVFSLHGCGVRTDGTLWCFGNSSLGKLGVPGAPSSATPIQVGADTDWVLATTGDAHSCGLKKSGEAYCWGNNDIGQLGDGTTTDSDSPVPVTGGGLWSMIDGGDRSTCGVRTDGTLWCWGSGIGVGLPQPTPTPIQIGMDSDLRSVDVGGKYVCGLHHGGALSCWGILYPDQPEPSALFSYMPFLIGSLGPVDRVTVGSFYSTRSMACAAGAAGTSCWGDNDHGQLGIGSFGNKTMPATVGSDAWKSVGVGTISTCGVRADGALFCWGIGGGWGWGYTQTPVQIGSLATWESVSVADSQRCALGTDGGISCWGYSSEGALGLGQGLTGTPDPKAVGADKDWTSVTLGAQHGCGIRAGGALYCWGSNSQNAVGNGGGANVFSPTQIGAGMTWSSVAAGTATCGIANGALHCWGGSMFGPAPQQVGSDTDWLAVSVGFLNRVCGIRAPGTMHCFGDGPLGDGTQASSPVPVQIGAAADWTAVGVGPMSCGIRADQSLHCWGADIGLAAVGEPTDWLTPVLVDAGSGVARLAMPRAYSHACVLRADQSIACWGEGDDGRLGHGDAWRTEPTKTN